MDDDVSVLFIEDDAETAEMYSLRLRRDGYSVSVARDGQEGLRVARETRPDLIYLDLRLPEVEGLQVLEQLRADQATAEIPVVILTNYGEPELRERGLSLGALEFLVKADTTPGQLAETADRWTEAPRAGRAELEEGGVGATEG